MLLLVDDDEIPVLSARITWNQRGPWSAELVLDATSAPEGSAVLEQGSVRLRGTITSPGSFAGRVGVTVVGGAGALGTAVQTRQYRGAPLSLILGDLGTDSGEIIRATDTDVGGTIVQMWARPAHSPRRVLDDLCERIGDYSWRTNDAGAVIVGPEAWEDSSASKARLLEEDQGKGLLTIDDELLELRPGTTWDGRRLTTVQVQWDHRRTRTKAWVLRDKPRGVIDALARAVEERLPSPIWTRLHPCRVHSQDTDRTMQLMPDSSDVPPMVGVPLRTGIPGLDVEVLTGARVQLAFEDGDPRQPIALPAFDRDLDKLKSVRFTADVEVTIDAPTVKVNEDGGQTNLGDTPANPIGRVGDLVEIALALVVPDPTKGIALTSPVGPVTGTIGTPALPAIAVGQILSGKDGVKA